MTNARQLSLLTLLLILSVSHNSSASQCDDLWARNLEFLDRHVVEAVGGQHALSGFHMARHDCPVYTDHMRFAVEEQYVQGGNLDCHSQTTPCKELREKPVDAMAGMDLRCGAGWYMSSWTLLACAGGNGKEMKFRYTCCRSDKYTEPATQHHTQCDQMVGEHLQFLDRHHVSCGNNAVLSQFSLEAGPCTGADMRIAYECMPPNQGCAVFHGSVMALEGQGVELTTNQGVRGWHYNDARCLVGERDFAVQTVSNVVTSCHEETTSCVLDGSGFVALDQADFDCGSDAIHSFVFESCASGTGQRGRYACCAQQQAQTAFRFTTACVTMGPLSDLMAHEEILCPVNTVLTRFKLDQDTCASTERRFVYYCKAV